MNYQAHNERYRQMEYRRCGRSGLLLPEISLGLWHNFGAVDTLDLARDILCRAFDAGITHFDLANNYGPPPGSAETTLGLILKSDLHPYRDELIISSKAGWEMWPGPYGNFGSRKYLVASLDQSLKRMGLDYVDIFYHHRPDPETPLEETMQALDFIVRSGRALYAGISSYPADLTRRAAEIMRELGTPLLIHQPKYHLFERWIEQGLTDTLRETGMGSIVFSPLAQGLLTNRYLNGIPDDSRAAKAHGFLQPEQINPDLLSKIKRLNTIAEKRGQSLAQMAIAWVLRLPEVTSALIGVSRVEQLYDNLNALKNKDFTADELDEIDRIGQ